MVQLTLNSLVKQPTGVWTFFFLSCHSGIFILNIVCGFNLISKIATISHWFQCPFWMVLCDQRIQAWNNQWPKKLWKIYIKYCEISQLSDYNGQVHVFCTYWVYIQRVNSSPPSAQYMCQWIRSLLVQIMACRLFGTKPLSKPMLG